MATGMTAHTRLAGTANVQRLDELRGGGMSAGGQQVLQCGH